MKTKKIIQLAASAGVAVLMLATAASANTISYTTNAAGTAFVAGNIGATPQTLNSISGQAATLVFTPNTNSITGFPSNINYGDFLLTCTTCTQVQSTQFGAFTFDLVVTDTTDGGSGQFVGTSTGGTVSSNSSDIAISWSPLQLGPGTTNSLSGDFGATIFTIPNVTSIVATNSGTPQGDTTVQGAITSATPEPATFALIGGGLVGLGFLRRKGFFSRP